MSSTALPGAYLRQLHVLAKTASALRRRSPVMAFAIELGELGDDGAIGVFMGSKNTMPGTRESRSFVKLPCASSTWSPLSRAPGRCDRTVARRAAEAGSRRRTRVKCSRPHTAARPIRCSRGFRSPVPVLPASLGEPDARGNGAGPDEAVALVPPHARLFVLAGMVAIWRLSRRGRTSHPRALAACRWRCSDGRHSVPVPHAWSRRSTAWSCGG